MTNKGALSKSILNKLKIAVAAVLIFYFSVNITYSLIGEDTPTITITINEEGNIVQTGSLLDEELWYPSKKATGVIRINNNYKNMNINRIGLDVNITKSKTNIDKNIVYNSFISNMKLTIIRGKLLVFADTILDKVSFSDVLYKPEEPLYDGYRIEQSKQFNILKNDSIDLKYTLYMDEDSGLELENLDAEVNLLINVGE